MAAQEDDFQTITTMTPEARANIDSYTALLNARAAMSVETSKNKSDARRTEYLAKEEKEKKDKIQRKAEVSEGVISFEPRPLVCGWDGNMCTHGTDANYEGTGPTWIFTAKMQSDHYEMGFLNDPSKCPKHREEIRNTNSKKPRRQSRPRSPSPDGH